MLHALHAFQAVAMYVVVHVGLTYVGLYSLCTELHASSMFYSLLSNGFFTQNACASEHCHNNEINVFMKLFFHVQWGPSMMSQGKITKLHRGSHNNRVYKDGKYCQMALIGFGTQTTELGL